MQVVENQVNVDSKNIESVNENSKNIELVNELIDTDIKRKNLDTHGEKPKKPKAKKPKTVNENSELGTENGEVIAPILVNEVKTVNENSEPIVTQPIENKEVASVESPKNDEWDDEIRAEKYKKYLEICEKYKTLELDERMYKVIEFLTENKDKAFKVNELHAVHEYTYFYGMGKERFLKETLTPLVDKKILDVKGGRYLIYENSQQKTEIANETDIICLALSKTFSATDLTTSQIVEKAGLQKSEVSSIKGCYKSIGLKRALRIAQDLKKGKEFLKFLNELSNDFLNQVKETKQPQKTVQMEMF